MILIPPATFHAIGNVKIVNKASLSPLLGTEAALRLNQALRQCSHPGEMTEWITCASQVISKWLF